jgi:sigma-B regulation protein RsbU (phosphoserine phosphatase)
VAVTYLQEQPSPYFMRYREAQSTPCAGDLVDVFASPGRRANIVIADVCGRDMRARGLACYLRNAVRALAEDNSPAAVLECANLALCGSVADYGDDRFASVFMATLSGRWLKYASAGHDLALLMSADGGHRHLAPTGAVIGVIDAERYQERMLVVAPGDWLILVTDGITEARDARGKFFGTYGVVRNARWALEREFDDPAARILDAARRHSRGALTDDASVLCVRFS